MDPIPTGLAAVAVNNPHTLYVGMVFESVGQARQFVNAYAIHHNFAVKNGFVKNKDQTLLLLCKCAKKPFNSRNLSIAKGTTGANGLTVETLGACFVTVLGKSASKSSSMTHGSIRSSLKNIVDTSSKIMVDLVQNSSASLTSITSVLNTTYSLSLLSRDVYNRTYRYTQRNEKSTVKFVEKLRDEGLIYTVNVAADNTLEALFYCKPHDVQKARLYGQVVIIDATYKTNKFRLPLVNIVTVDNNMRTIRIALCFVTTEQTNSYTWVMQQLKKIVFPDQSPDVVITDADKALMKALSTVFPTTMNQLCRWHVEQNIFYRKYFKAIGDFDAFMKCIKQIANSVDKEDQDKMLAQLQTDHPDEAVNYFLTQWWVNGKGAGFSESPKPGTPETRNTE